MSSELESLTGRHGSDFEEWNRPPREPHDLVEAWWHEASESGVREPRAITLGTVDSDGVPAARTIAISSLSAGKVVFATTTCSAKAIHLRARPFASCHFYWREIGRQLTLVGPVSLGPPQLHDQLWQQRPAGLDRLTVAARQSRDLDDEDEDRLRAVADDLTPQLKLERPDHFVSVVLTYQRAEFWQAMSNRLHRRLSFTFEDSIWSARRLQP